MYPEYYELKLAITLFIFSIIIFLPKIKKTKIRRENREVVHFDGKLKSNGMTRFVLLFVYLICFIVILLFSSKYKSELGLDQKIFLVTFYTIISFSLLLRISKNNE